MKRFALIIVLPLAACAMSSGVLNMGPDTYSVQVQAAPAAGGAAGARAKALTEANAKCASLTKEIVVTNVFSEVTNGYGAGNVDVTFRCLAKGDPDLQRPVYSGPPTAVIEDRRTR